MSQAERIRSINSPGWDGVDSSVTHLELPNTSAQRDLDIQYKRCFDTEAGKKSIRKFTGNNYRATRMDTRRRPFFLIRTGGAK